MNILYFASVDFYQKPNPSFHLMQSMTHRLYEVQIESETLQLSVVDR